MARSMNSNNPSVPSSHSRRAQAQETGLSSTDVTKVQVPTTQTERNDSGKFSRKFFRLLFYLHLFLIVVLVFFLLIRGLLSTRTHHFYPKKWYPPLLLSVACAEIIAFSWQLFTNCNPSKALKAAFWLSPVLTLGIGFLHLSIGSPGSLALGVLSIILAVVLSLYACWVNPRFDYAAKVLEVSIESRPTKTPQFGILFIIVSVFYSCFFVAGTGGAKTFGTPVHILFIFVLLLSLIWTSQVIKNTFLVTIAHVKYYHFARGADFDTRQAFCKTIKHSLGSICIGSILVPIIDIIRGLARAMNLAVEDADEFLFSCVSCCSGIRSGLVSYGSRWGFVHSGVHDKGFVQASSDTWELFRRNSLEPLIDSDLTSPFCFLCGMTGGAICSLVSGSWEFSIHKSDAIELSIYAFFIGYFTCRVAMAWPQACVLSYYVAYAENPRNSLFDSTIPDRIRKIERSRAPRAPGGWSMDTILTAGDI